MVLNVFVTRIACIFLMYDPPRFTSGPHWRWRVKIRQKVSH